MRSSYKRLQKTGVDKEIDSGAVQTVGEDNHFD